MAGIMELLGTDEKGMEDEVKSFFSELQIGGEPFDKTIKKMAGKANEDLQKENAELRAKLAKQEEDFSKELNRMADAMDKAIEVGGAGLATPAATVAAMVAILKKT